MRALTEILHQQGLPQLADAAKADLLVGYTIVIVTETDGDSWYAGERWCST